VTAAAASFGRGRSTGELIPVELTAPKFSRPDARDFFEGPRKIRRVAVAHLEGDVVHLLIGVPQQAARDCDAETNVVGLCGQTERFAEDANQVILGNADRSRDSSMVSGSRQKRTMTSIAARSMSFSSTTTMSAMTTTSISSTSGFP
jgi:hypothetical protein